ncbi:hypothetical protein F5887DRAFT_1080649 [Amanita rubescens]|nr:hypothetical protein F5887DRAFT_1080649 [Amanita rubescens]
MVQMCKSPKDLQVVANQKENSSPVDTNNASSGSISPKPPSCARSGIATRAANAHKRPGLLALDDEDLKALQKKQEAAQRRQAKAVEKNTYQARLLKNTDRIAAFEDALTLQHADEQVNAARPVTRAAQKVKRPVAQPMAQQAVVEAVVVQNSDSSPAIEEHLESDASRMDDTDYTPPSESESKMEMDYEDDAPKQKGKKSKRGEARAHIEAHRQFEPRTNVKSSTGGNTNTGKHPLDSDSQLPPTAKRTKSTEHSSQHSNQLPLRNYNGTLTNAPDAKDSDNRFNLQYGGIMDDDIQEMTPLPVKASQVKVTTKVEHNTPLIKVEALDPGLPGRRRGKTKDRSSMGCLNLTPKQLESWRKLLIPAFRSVLGALTNPWDNSNPELLNELIYIYRLVLPDAARDIAHNGPEYLIACQRGCEWRARIAREVLQATERYLNDQCGEAPTAIAEYVGELLEGARYMWETHDAPQPSGYQGLFLAPYIVAGIRAHLEMTAQLPPELQISEPPRGALALATVAAERALKAWESGYCTLGEDVSKKKEEEFSEVHWGGATNAVIPAILRMSERKWQKILDKAMEASSIPRSMPPSLPTTASHAPDDARSLAYESDSE